METTAASAEMTVLAWSVILLFVHIVVQVLLAWKNQGLGYLMSARDDDKSVSHPTDRVTRGLRNYVETYGAFVALALALVVTGKAGGYGATGAWVWFIARVVYVPVFAAGIPVLRTGVWTVSIIGLLMMLVKLMSAGMPAA